MEYLKNFIWDFINVLNEMSPYLLLGFFFAGLLKVFLPQKFIDKQLGGANLKSVLYASLIGVPMPLCSCGVIPTGVSFYKNGAGKGSTVSFLISTPQTGVDSILATYALLGLPFAIIRPVVALITGVFGGQIANWWTRQELRVVDKAVERTEDSCGCSNSASNCSSDVANSCCGDNCCDKEVPTTCVAKWKMVFKYGFVDFLQDIAKWLMIGIILAVLISILIPDDFFVQFIGNAYLEMLVILLVAIPLYVCATGSIPIVAMLMLKGLSPGAALVFLMAGPATNMATITVLRKTMGQKALWAYLSSIVLGAVFFGSLINYLLPAEWFRIEAKAHMHGFHLIPEWMAWLSTILLLLLIGNGYYHKYKHKHTSIETRTMDKIHIRVKGMHCNHCKKSVETNVAKLPHITSAEVNLEQERLTVEGKEIDLVGLQTIIESLGFEYGGKY